MIGTAGKTLIALVLATVMPSRAATLTEVGDFGDNPGHLRLFAYVPDNIQERAPLVVVAHGCMQTAAEIAEATGWPTLADRFGIILAFPETSKANEPLGGCFRSWEPAHQKRGAGEPASVAAMIGWMAARNSVDPTRVFITGLSGGGHLANIMLATYPETFSAGAPMSSFPYACATTLADLKPCATTGPGFTSRQWGDLVRAASPGYKGPWPRVQIWHGGKDIYISPAGQEMQVAQWTNVHRLDMAAPVPDRLKSAVRRHYGTGVVESILIPDMGHAVATAPGQGARQCGKPGPFAADVGLCAAYWQAVFFGIVKDAD